ncbi:solute carrier family 44 protein member 2 [Trypanosoma grayi]|uniref:solute carrier family 44 protein member 2 n=1 Tax=Trypanosoma grayi TaxID=71804 RepID=UPI0004F44561|nr:solute carrier family 44 protein member 2 [Trypanosoma grayi]KEG09583.1 solute carrier family 44 protein member 2 [Trypanosoma grayi]
MGCCCCCSRKTTDVPEKYEENRSCTDVIFAVLFIAAWGAFIALGVIAFKGGDIKAVVNGNDYLGYYCGEGEAPEGFAGSIPAGAPFQSSNWGENKYSWYPVPLSKGVKEVLNVPSYANLGVCVQTCPRVDVDALKDFLDNSTDPNPESLARMTVYSYGKTTIDGATVNPASKMYVLYDTAKLIRKCLPSVVQPLEVQNELAPSPVVEKVYTFAMQGVHEVENSWRVLVIEVFICLVLCFLFIFLMRFLIGFVVWFVLLGVFFLLAGGGAISFFLYHTKGESSYLEVSGIRDYATLFLVLAIVLWVLALVYLFIILSLCSKVRLVCAIIKIAGRVLASGPLMLAVPMVTCVLIIGVLAWSVLIAICLFSAKERGTELSLVPVTDALQYEGAPVVNVSGTEFYKVATGVLNSKTSMEYLMIADLFGFLWTMGFLSAVCFTVISFVSIFWYFSSLEDSEKAVPACGVCKAVCWTLFYHAGTLALGSLLVAIVQTLRFILSYFAKKAKVAVEDNHVIRCLMCYLECFLACFERVLSVINKNAYVMMCLTSQCFCVAACNAIGLILSYAVELLFLGWIVEVVMFFGKLFVVGGCCVSGYFLCTVSSLAPEVEVKVMPLIVIAIMAYFVCSVFFSVYSSSADALLVCYCYDRKVNESRAMYYVPAELEHQIADYSQKDKLRDFNARQEAAHQEGEQQPHG